MNEDQLNNLLAELPPAEPPEGLRERILQNLPIKEVSTDKPASARIYQLPVAVRKPLLSMAAALLLAVALVQLAPENFDTGDMQQVSATLVKSPTDYLAIELPGLTASVDLKPAADNFTIEVKLESAIATSTLIEAPDAGYTLTLAGDNTQPGARIEVNNNALLITGAGNVETIARLELTPGQTPTGESSIRVVFKQQGRVVHESRLLVP